MNSEVAQAIRDEACSRCRMSSAPSGPICEVGSGPRKARIMVVSKMPNSGKYQEELEGLLTEVGIELEECYFTAASKCRSFEVNPSPRDVKACRPFLDAEIELIKPKWILAFGNEALLSTTGHSGIMKYRGRPIDKGGYSVFPTISPSAVKRNPGQKPAFMADLHLFVSQVRGKASGIPEPPIVRVNTKARLKSLIKILQQSELLSYDIETTGANPWDLDGAIVSLAGTCVIPGRKDPIVWALPLYHPQSPWELKWQKVLRILAPHLEQVPKQVAHNGKFDAKWLRYFGVRAKVTFDTMLAAHLLDENRQKGLKPQAASRLGVPPWGIDTRNLLAEPLPKVLKYNALDTFYTYHIYLQLRQELIDQPRLRRIFQRLMMPANEILIDSELQGVWVDRELLATNTKIGFDTRDELDRKLMEWVPMGPGHEDCEECGVTHEVAGDWPTNAKGKPVEVNFNASNFARWWLFDYLELPILARGKEKDDGSPGAPSMAEDIMLELKGEHPAVELMLERARWQKICSAFLSAYDELLTEDDRIHTTFKLTGTVTGRTSSGKEDAEKLTARRPTRGVNLQQVPRDVFLRGLFGAPPGYTFVEADFSQVELRVVAFLSREPTMLTLYQTGQDIHRATAAWVLGVPESQVGKEERKKAKAVNFGFVYGMGARKFVYTAFTKYELHFSLKEAEGIRKAFFSNFSGLPRWHARQRALAHKYGRVQSPIGRIRRLPDIHSSDRGVMSEAERQAINSPVQGFASDMTMLSMVEIHRQFGQLGVDAQILGSVHDALLFQVKTEQVGTALPIIKDTMENLPLEEKFGVVVDIPIIADLKVGTHWGTARELEPDEVYDWHD